MIFFIIAIIAILIFMFFMGSRENFSADYKCINVDPIQNGMNGDVPFISNIFRSGNRLITWRPSDSTWYIKGLGNNSWSKSTGNMKIKHNSLPGDVPLISNLFGNGNQLILWRPSNGTWYIKGVDQNDWEKSAKNLIIQHGSAGDVPLIANVLGDGNRLITWRPPTATAPATLLIKGKREKSWSESEGNVELKITYGEAGDVPFINNIFGDGVRLILWKPSYAMWYISNILENVVNKNETIALNGNKIKQDGLKGDVPLIANVFGDGNRLITRRPSNGTWYIKGLGKNHWSESKGNVEMLYGEANDVPLIANAFGDGNRIIIWRPSNGTWYMKCLGT